MDEDTHFIFDEKKINISPNLISIITFLQEIEAEVESLLSLDNKLESIRKQYLETIRFVEFLVHKLEENSIDFSYSFSENPETMTDKLKFERPVRSEMIVIFAHLEVLLCLDTAYDNKTSDDNKIRNIVMNQQTVKNFIKNFCLNPSNEWGKKNEKRLKHITVDEMRWLRNSLTHFFSVGKSLAISHSNLDDKARRLEEAIAFKAKFLSPEDLQQIVSGAAKLLIKKWSEDCKNAAKENSTDFKERILSVKKVVTNNGAVIVRNTEIKI